MQTLQRNQHVAKALAANLFLSPQCIMALSNYWLIHYQLVPATINLVFRAQPVPGVIRNWLTSLLDCICNAVVELSCFLQYGMATNLSLSEEWIVCISFLNRPDYPCPMGLPLKYFETNNNSAVIECFSYLLNPKNECFWHVSPVGSHNEIAAELFLFDDVLKKAYKPDAFVLACLLLLVRVCDEEIPALAIKEKNHVVSKLFVDSLSKVSSEHSDTAKLLLRLKNAAITMNFEKFREELEVMWKNMRETLLSLKESTRKPCT